MYKTQRTEARPPKMRRLPLLWPLSLLMGARPTRAAIFWRFKVPSSGRSANKVKVVTGPTPGTERSTFSLACHRGQTATIWRIASLSRSISSVNHWMCASRWGRMAASVVARRFFSMVNILTNCCRRLRIPAKRACSPCLSGRAAGRMVAANRASSKASNLSVLAYWPSALAK